MTANWVDEVLTFWFDEVGQEGWFKGNSKLDTKIRDRFGALHEKLGTEALKESAQDPRSALAAAILFDQFPRNMFRGTAKAFSTDDLAVRIAREAVTNRFDEKLSPKERQFLYMPFMHSEVSADQEHAVMLFKTLDDEEALRFAIEHRDIIQRFGRFPHRNFPLGRKSTPEELAFLEEHKGFGQ